MLSLLLWRSKPIFFSFNSMALDDMPRVKLQKRHLAKPDWKAFQNNKRCGVLFFLGNTTQVIFRFLAGRWKRPVFCPFSNRFIGCSMPLAPKISFREHQHPIRLKIVTPIIFREEFGKLLIIKRLKSGLPPKPDFNRFGNYPLTCWWITYIDASLNHAVPL